LLYFKIANNKFSALFLFSAENLLFLQRKTSDMTNETTTSILEYADTHLKFSMEDLFAYLHKKDWHKQVFPGMVFIQARE
jgi:hypothetical protein